MEVLIPTGISTPGNNLSSFGITQNQHYRHRIQCARNHQNHHFNHHHQAVRLRFELFALTVLRDDILSYWKMTLKM